MMPIPFKPLRPLLVTLMVGLIGLSIVELIELFLADWDGRFLVLGWMIIALQAFYSHWLLGVRPRRGGDRWKFRGIELLLSYFIIQAAYQLGFGWNSLLADAGSWLRAPLLLLADLGGILMFLIALLFWDAAGATAADFERVDEPLSVSRGDGTVPAMSGTTRSRLAPMLAHERPPPHPGPSPLERLSTRFFWGGGLLLFLTALTRIGITRLLSVTYTWVPGLVLGVLIYFLIGFVLLGQVRYALLYKRWEIEGLAIDDLMRRRWLRYSFVLIALALGIAFLLPTGYTLDLLATVSAILEWVMFAIMLLYWLLYLLIIYPLAWLMWLLLALLQQEGAPPPPERQPEFDFGGPVPGANGPEWVELLRSLLFWLVLLGMMSYLLYSYLRDRPELRAFLLSLAPVRLLIRLWQALRGELGALAGVVQANLPPGLFRRGPGNQAGRTFNFFRLGALPPREKVLYYYRSILQRARAIGFPRRGDQTPYEYDETLEPHLPEAERELERLTDAFVEARYSRHEITPEAAEAVRAEWERVRAAIRRLQREEREESED